MIRISIKVVLNETTHADRKDVGISFIPFRCPTFILRLEERRAVIDIIFGYCCSDNAKCMGKTHDQLGE